MSGKEYDFIASEYKVFDPESLDPEPFGSELRAELLMTEGLRPKGDRRET